jgi:predicted DNA-binding transcriptional regulator AlpA
MPVVLDEGKEPKTVLLRARDIVKWIGISRPEFHRCVRAGLIPFKRIKKGGRAWYKTADIKRIFVENFRMRS